MRTAHTLIPALTFALLAGCAATMTAVEHRELKVETQMSESVFLDVENRAERSVYLDIRNTSDQRFDVAERIRAEIIGRGYQ